MLGRYLRGKMVKCVALDTIYCLEAKFPIVVEILRVKLPNRLVWTLFITWTQSNYYSFTWYQGKKIMFIQFEPNGQNFRENITISLISMLVKFYFIKPKFFPHL